MSSASEIYVSQIGNNSQNTLSDFPVNAESQIPYWDQQQQFNFENVFYQQRHPSYQQPVMQNQIPFQTQMTHLWPQSQAPSPSLNVNQATPHHIIKNTQSRQPPHSQMVLNNTLYHQLRPSDDQNLQFHQQPHAKISLVSTPKGGYKAILKRNKRKRTMFTTEQLEFLESYFCSKPYINRDERQVLVKTLNVSDSAVKVWFQNRRIRSKRDQESMEEEDSGISTGSSPLLSSTSASASDNDSTPDLDKILLELTKNRQWKKNERAEIEEILNCPLKSEFNSQTLSSKLDEIECEIKQRTDQFGIVHVDGKLMSEIITVIDQVLPQDLDLDLPQNESEKTNDSDENNIINEEIHSKSDLDSKTTSKDENLLELKSVRTLSNNSKAEIVGIIHDGEIQVTTIENVGFCYFIDNGEDNENKTCTVAMYEPISPAESIEEDTVTIDNKIIPRDKLQEIFNRVFC